MKLSAVLQLATALSVALAAGAQAHETKTCHKKADRHEQVCVCSMNEAELNLPPIPPVPAIPPIPPVPHTGNHLYFNMPVPPPGQPNIRVFRHGNGDEDRIVIIRKHRHDSADANGDGKVTHREFITEAEKRFKELDEDGDGALSEEEAVPEGGPDVMPFTMALPPEPPAPPTPPTPPTPPAPPNDE